MPPPLWYRTFLRTSSPDFDTVANAFFRKETFTDFYGKFLQSRDHSGIFTFDKLVSQFFNKDEYKFAIYCVADGAFIPRPKEPCPWFNPHIRFVAVVEPAKPTPGDDWVVFIVASNELHAQAKDRFLQVASWDPTISEYRYYAAAVVQPKGEPSGDIQGWIYEGRSSDAIKPETTYLGPFNGHVNGSLIMKELQRPWYHWDSGMNQNLSESFSKNDNVTFTSAPYLTGSDGVMFSMVSSAGALQFTIQNGINKWFAQRAAIEFPEPRIHRIYPQSDRPSPDAHPRIGAIAQTPISYSQLPVSQSAKTKGYYPRVVQRWMSHVLLTTTINISTATTNPDRSTDADWVAPVDHFIDNMLLHSSRFSELLPHIPQFPFTQKAYDQAANDLNLWLIQEYPDNKSAPAGYTLIKAPAGTLGGEKDPGGNDHYTTNFLLVQKGEGVPFVILQPSYEDARGALEMQTIRTYSKATLSLLSDRTFNALMMLDIWNPVYSWRRGVLMMYVPKTTEWSEASQSYDLESVFIKNIKASPRSREKDAPEYQFLQLRKQSVEQHRERISTYLQIISDRVGTVDGLRDYLRLAESRRRIYRPVPLDEFGYTLPYAVGFKNPSRFLEMTEDGTVQQMPERGRIFLYLWINTLWTDNPQLIPTNYPDDKNHSFSLTGDNDILEAGNKPRPLSTEEKKHCDTLQALRGWTPEDQNQQRGVGVRCPVRSRIITGNSVSSSN